MINNSIYVFLVFLLSFILSSCTTLKEGLSGKKKDTSDAFLVKKKNPLTIPKNYSELPVPVSEEDNNDDDEDLNTNVKLAFEDLFGNQNAEISNTKSNSNLEKSIIEKIKNK